MMKLFNLFLAVIGAIALLAAPGPAAADYYVFPSYADGIINSAKNIAGAYREFTFGLNDLVCAGGIDNAVYMHTAARVEYTPTNNSQPGWVNHGIDWYPDVKGPLIQHTYVIRLPSSTGGQPPYIPGLHPINSLTGADFDAGGIAGLVVLLYDVNVDLPDTAGEFLDPAFLANVSAIVAFTPGVSTAYVFEKTQVPEPGTLILFGGGLIVLGALRRKFGK